MKHLIERYAITIPFFVILISVLLFVTCLQSCSTIGKGCPNNVAAWEKRVKFNK